MRIGLVLSGGGANGAFEAGVVAAVEEAGLRPSVLSGTSAGALNVAAIAQGMDAPALVDLWRGIRARDVYAPRRDLWRLPRPAGWLSGGGLADRALDGVGWTWLLDTAPLRATLERVLGSETLTVEDGRIVSVSAVEMATGDLVRFTNALPPSHRLGHRYREVELGVDHLLASAAIPLAFRPAEVDGHWWWDGGLVANTPLAPAMAHEPDAVIVVTTATRQRPAPEPASLRDAIGLLVDNLLGHSLATDLKHARLVNELSRLDPGRTDVKEVELVVVEPTGLALGGSLDFGAELMERRIELGRDLGRRTLEAWERTA